MTTPLPTVIIPEWAYNLAFNSDWCIYNGEVLFAVLNTVESNKIKFPVYDLAVCATQGLNQNFTKQVVWNEKYFKRHPVLSDTW